ncbi:MAG: hypothetical protein JW995_09220 [Melioribacteraceae bacterium]|nr:hypothetical protein [Melioribacteraceae bacterium]
MVLDLIVKDTGDGYTAEIPSINGCESWAHEEETAINNVVELLRYYLNLPGDLKIIIDKARGTSKKQIFKLVFDK